MLRRVNLIGLGLAMMQAWTIFTANAGAAEAFPEKPLRTFLDNYCVSCHDADTKKGGLDLSHLSTDLNNSAVFNKWVKVHDRIRAGEMPPKDKRNRPAPAESLALLSMLNGDLARADLAQRGNSGRAVFRRLNRTEYENTLRDLLCLPALSVKELLPEDGQAAGFDKSAASLDLSYVQLSKYMEAADVALDAAIVQHATRPDYFKVHIPGTFNTMVAHAFTGGTIFLKDFKYDATIIPMPTERTTHDAAANKIKHELLKKPYYGTIGVLRSSDAEFKPKFPFMPVYGGKYKIRMSTWSFMWEKGHVLPSKRTEVGALVTEGRTIGYFDAPSLTPTVTEMEVWLKPYEEFHFNAASIWPTPLKGDVTEYVRPGIAIDWLEVEGPILDQWPPESHRRLLGDLPFALLDDTPRQKGGKRALKYNKGEGDVHVPKRLPENAYKIAGHGKPFITNLSAITESFSPVTVVSKAPESDARKLLADFLPRAFRRPVSPDEVQTYVELFNSRLADGDMFEMAMRTAYKAALCSPDFLFLKEPAGSLDQYAVASRLSYFLWNSMPDDELFVQASKGKLHDSATLDAQVERMLHDPKSQRFIVDFTDQWLDLQEMDLTTPDKKLYPEFRPILHDSMPAETRAFFRELVDRNLSVTNVVDSNFAMINQRLAELYGIRGVEGDAIRKVPLPPDSGRGGFLTQAAVLKVTANGTSTSPVKRGAWVMRKIVAVHPDPPPPDVPAIEPDIRGTTTIREQLAKHRANASCAACHAKIDPPGFALESYNVIGGLQTHYRALPPNAIVKKPFLKKTFLAETEQSLRKQIARIIGTIYVNDDLLEPSVLAGHPVGYMWGPKVDPSGELPDGRSFDDMTGLKKCLLADPRALAGNMLGQMTVYATGTPIGFADRAAADKILDESAASGYGIRSLIHGIVQSTLFQNK